MLFRTYFFYMAVDYPDCQVICLNSDYCIASWHNVAITIWQSSPDMPAIRKVGQLRKHLTKQYPQGCLGLTLCITGMPLPSQTVRKEIAQWVRDYKNFVKLNIIVIDGTGFWASCVRALITDLSVLAGKETHNKVFDDLSEAATYLQPHFTVGAGSVQDLTVLVYQLQNEMSEARDRLSYSVAQ